MDTNNTNNKTIISIIVIVLVGIGAYFLVKGLPSSSGVTQNQATTTPAAQLPEVDKTKTLIGKSVEGRDIVAYHFLPEQADDIGTTTEILFVGGIHGGYEWNTALVAGQLMNYLKNNSSVIPANVKVTVIPVLNPDGLNKVVGTTTPNFTAGSIPVEEAMVVSGRFNGNNVDINRNFDCDWQQNAKWQNKTVSGGTEAFSEPESQAIKNYIETNKPAAVFVWYSAAGGVFASNCHNGVSAETNTLTKIFAKASGYPAHESFDFYATTGDMTNWLAKINVPAISILLTNHTDTEWSKNLAGIKALLQHYAQ